MQGLAQRSQLMKPLELAQRQQQLKMVPTIQQSEKNRKTLEIWICILMLWHMGQLNKLKQLKKILKNLKCLGIEFVFWTILTPGKSGSLFHPRHDRLTNQSNRHEAPMGEMCFYRKIQGEEKLMSNLESSF